MAKVWSDLAPVMQAMKGDHGEASVAGAGVARVGLTATHFSFLPSAAFALSVSSSEVTLSSVSASVSASAPVLVSDSDDDVDSEAVPSVVVEAAGVDSVDAVDVAAEESLFSARTFLAFAARSFLSSFCV